VTLAACVAVAFAIAVVTLTAVNLHPALAPRTTPLSPIALQTVVIAVLLTGYRHLVRVPADPRANWVFQLAWSGDSRRYLEGSTRAALTLLALPALLVLGILGVLVFDVRAAMAHAAVGAATAVLLMTLLFLTYRKLPFATPYTGAADLKAVAPLYSVALLLGAVTLAAVERATLGSLTNEIVLLATLVAVIAGAQLVAMRRQALPLWIVFDEGSDHATQRLELTR